MFRRRGDSCRATFPATLQKARRRADTPTQVLPPGGTRRILSASVVVPEDPHEHGLTPRGESRVSGKSSFTSSGEKNARTATERLSAGAYGAPWPYAWVDVAYPVRGLCSSSRRPDHPAAERLVASLHSGLRAEQWVSLLREDPSFRDRVSFPGRRDGDRAGARGVAPRKRCG